MPSDDRPLGEATGRVEGRVSSLPRGTGLVINALRCLLDDAEHDLKGGTPMDPSDRELLLDLHKWFYEHAKGVVVSAYHTLAIYREGNVYDDTAAWEAGHWFAGKPVLTSQDIYQQLVDAGVEPSAHGVSVYVRIYDNGQVKALAGSTERFRLIRGAAREAFDGWWANASAVVTRQAFDPAGEPDPALRKGH
jgi:hypothetical protein